VQLVLRSYDNRTCYTERRPDAYLYSGLTGGETKIVCDISTGCPKSDRDFGTCHRLRDGPMWLWKTDCDTSSRLLVITTPYREGRHYATSPLDFVPAVKHLEQLHAAGYMHGDIRCFNTALGPDGGLIDFDMGGKLAGEEGQTAKGLTYPRGYQFVQDGLRLGRAGEPMKKYHDVYALTQVITNFHFFYPPNTDSGAGPIPWARRQLQRLGESLKKDRTKDLNARKDRLRVFGYFTGLSEPEIEERTAAHMKEVMSFLEDAAALQWKVTPTCLLRGELKAHGLFEESSGDEESPGGGGSADGTDSKACQKCR
jgi:hypothetical protein